MNLSRQRSCDGKARHASKATANAARNKIVAQGRARARDLAVYSFVHCSGWHVGHGPGSRRQP